MAFGPRPRSQGELVGIDLVICLLTPPEIAELEMHWLEALHLPIEDRQIPSDIPRLDQTLEKARSALAQGETVYVHCRAGIGRAAVVTAALLHHLGMPGDIWAELSKARGVEVPDTDEQKAWVNERYSRPRGQSLEQALEMLSQPPDSGNRRPEN